MHSELTQEQIQFYQDNGFVVIDNFLTPDELALWRQYVDEAVRQREDRKLADGRMRAGDSYYDNVFVQRINLWQDHAGMRQLMLDARLGKMAADLAGVDGIRIWHDQALIKQPWANPTGWHLDNPYWSFYSRQAISIWVALDDATLENGCLYFLPGTHQTATFDNSGIGQNIGDLFKVYPQWASIKSVAAPMKAGSCSFHNGLTAHGAGANMTPGWRRAMTCAYMPDGSTFNGQQNVLPPEMVARLKVGDVIEDDAQNPLIYHRTKPYLTQV
jgi:ectoine hydroxylase-related dioxygenase (phytanoyl-CoA dioxygenase family)